MGEIGAHRRQLLAGHDGLKQLKQAVFCRQQSWAAQNYIDKINFATRVFIE